MSFRSFFFESPYALIPALVLVAFVLLSVWSRRRTPLTGRLAVSGLMAMPLLIAMQCVVVTDRERIARVCRELAHAVGRGDTAALAPLISEDFQTRRGDRMLGKSELLKEVERLLHQWDIQEERLGGFETMVDGDTGTTTFRARCRLISNDLIVARHLSRWQIRLSRTDAGWRVIGIKPLPTRLLPYDSLSDILR